MRYSNFKNTQKKTPDHGHIHRRPKATLQAFLVPILSGCSWLTENLFFGLRLSALVPSKPSFSIKVLDSAIRAAVGPVGPQQLLPGGLSPLARTRFHPAFSRPPRPLLPRSHVQLARHPPRSASRRRGLPSEATLLPSWQALGVDGHHEGPPPPLPQRPARWVGEEVC